MMRSAEDRAFFRRTLETSIRLGLLLLLLLWAFQLALPFIPPIVWGIVLAIAVQPVYQALCRLVGGRGGLAAALLVIGALLILIVPAVLLATNLVESVTGLAQQVEQGTLRVPPPPDGVADWPIAGDRIHAFWSAASRNLEAALEPLLPQLKSAGHWVLETGATTGVGLLLFSLSIVLAGVLLVNGEAAAENARRVARRLVPERGDEFVALARSTVQSVTRGILGTAVIQATLASVGLVAAGVPAFGLWALLVLLLAVVQLPTLLVLVPIIVWVFGTSSTWVAVPFAVWSLAVGLSDNVLKPILLGRGSAVPMAVIFVGAIGGFIRGGIIGLFVGAVVLSVAYNLFQAWLEEGETESS
jgi:predicted PurR-regulated permease PerM